MVSTIRCFKTELIKVRLHRIYANEPHLAKRGPNASAKSIDPGKPVVGTARPWLNLFPVGQFSATVRNTVPHNAVLCNTKWILHQAPFNPLPHNPDI